MTAEHFILRGGEFADRHNRELVAATRATFEHYASRPRTPGRVRAATTWPGRQRKGEDR